MMLPHTAFGTPARVVAAVGGALSAAAAYAFIYNLWRTIDGAPSRPVSTEPVMPVARATLRRKTAG
jgi:hypothetical protein